MNDEGPTCEHFCVLQHQSAPLQALMDRNTFLKPSHRFHAGRFFWVILEIRTRGNLAKKVAKIISLATDIFMDGDCRA